MLSFLIAFAGTALLTPLVILLAHRLGWVAKPRQDRWHQRPTALMGGIGICAGTLVAASLSGELGALLPVLIPAVGMFALGFLDDRVQLRPHHKLVGQLAAAAWLLSSGVCFESLPLWLSLPLTLFWVLAVTNAVNLLDNMDGLAAGVSAICAVVLAAYAGFEGPTAMLALAVAGACAGFLLYNFNPARVFMGDCGSMFLGFTLAAVAVQGAHRAAPNLVLSLLVPVAVLAVPIFDTTLVSIARTLNGRSISQGGRDHSSHRLVSLGLSERGTVLVLWMLTALFGLLAVASIHLRLLVVLPLAAVLVLALGALGLFLGFIKVYHAQEDLPEQARLVGGRLQYTRQRLQMALDLVLIPLAFMGAHVLRFEGDPSPDVVRCVLTVLPLVLVAKLVGLALCRAYRGVWRVAGLVDAIRAGAGAALGSGLAAAALALGPGFKDLSRAALVIDWLVFTALAVTSRLGYVLLREAFALLPAREAPRVVMLGSGPEAVSLAQRLRDPFSPTRATVVGILDDDPARQGRMLDGVPVLGPVNELPRVLEQERVQRCLLAVPPTSRRGQSLIRYCREQGIDLYQDLESLHPLRDRVTAE